MKGRGAVDHDEVVPISHLRDGLLELLGRIRLVDELALDGHEVGCGRHDVEPGELGRVRELGDARLPEEELIAAAVDGTGRDAEPRGRVRLRIEIDHEHTLLGDDETRGQVDRGRGFTHATLLVGNGDDSTHSRHRLPAEPISINGESLLGAARTGKRGRDIVFAHFLASVIEPA